MSVVGLLHDIAAERFCGVARRHYVALDIGGVAGEDYSRPVRFERERARGVVEVFEALRPDILLSAEHVKAQVAHEEPLTRVQLYSRYSAGAGTVFKPSYVFFVRLAPAHIIAVVYRRVVVIELFNIDRRAVFANEINELAHMVVVCVAEEPAGYDSPFAVGRALAQKAVYSLVVVGLKKMSAVYNKKAVVRAAQDIAHSAVDI